MNHFKWVKKFWKMIKNVLKYGEWIVKVCKLKRWLLRMKANNWNEKNLKI